MQLKASSGNNVKHSVAFIQSLPGGGSDKANPYVLENRNVFVEGMVSETRKRTKVSLCHTQPTSYRSFDSRSANNDFVVGRRVRYGAHTALVEIADPGLEIVLNADDEIYQNGNIVGKVKTRAALVPGLRNS